MPFGPRHLLGGWSYLLPGQEINSWTLLDARRDPGAQARVFRPAVTGQVWGVFRLSKCLWCGMRGRTQFPHPGLCLTHQGSMLVASLVYVGVGTPVSKPSLQEFNVHCFYFMLPQISESGSIGLVWGLAACNPSWPVGKPALGVQLCSSKPP